MLLTGLLSMLLADVDQARSAPVRARDECGRSPHVPLARPAGGNLRPAIQTLKSRLDGLRSLSPRLALEPRFTALNARVTQMLDSSPERGLLMSDTLEEFAAWVQETIAGLAENAPYEPAASPARCELRSLKEELDALLGNSRPQEPVRGR